MVDGLVSAGIYVLVAIPVDLAFTAYRIGGWTSLSRQLGLPETLGRISAQFTLLVILVSVLAFLRQRAGTVRFVLLDWKWWVIALGRVCVAGKTHRELDWRFLDLPIP